MNLEQLLDEMKAKSEAAAQPETVLFSELEVDDNGNYKMIVIDLDFENQYEITLYLNEYNEEIKKYEPSAKARKYTEELLEKTLNTDLDGLKDLVDTNIEIYINENQKGRLTPAPIRFGKKFEKEHKGATFTATVVEAYDNGNAQIFNVSPSNNLSIDKIYTCKRNYSAWNDKLKRYIKKPADHIYRYEQLKTQFGVETMEELIGKEISVTVYANVNEGFHGRLAPIKDL